MDRGAAALELRVAAGPQDRPAALVDAALFADVPLVVVAERGDDAPLAHHLDLERTAAVEQERRNAVRELQAAAAGGIGAQRGALDPVRALRQVELHPAHRRITVQQQQQIDRVAAHVEQPVAGVDGERAQRAVAPLRDQRSHEPVAGVPAPVGAHVERDAVALHRLRHRVGLRQRGRHRLLGVDGARAVFGGVDDDLGTVLGLRGDADDVGPFRREHLPVVGVLVRGRHAVALAGARHHVGPLVGAGHQGGALARLVRGGVRVGVRLADLVVDEGADAPAADQGRAIVRHDAGSRR